MMSSDFMIHFSEIEDPRITNHNSRHKFIDILVMGFIATLCSCDDWKIRLLPQMAKQFEHLEPKTIPEAFMLLMLELALIK